MVILGISICAIVLATLIGVFRLKHYRGNMHAYWQAEGWPWAIGIWFALMAFSFVAGLLG